MHLCRGAAPGPTPWAAGRRAARADRSRHHPVPRAAGGRRRRIASCGGVARVGGTRPSRTPRASAVDVVGGALRPARRSALVGRAVGCASGRRLVAGILVRIVTLTGTVIVDPRHACFGSNDFCLIVSRGAASALCRRPWILGTARGAAWKTSRCPALAPRATEVSTTRAPVSSPAGDRHPTWYREISCAGIPSHPRRPGTVSPSSGRASALAAWPWPPRPPSPVGSHYGCPSPSVWFLESVRSALGPVGFVCGELGCGKHDGSIVRLGRKQRPQTDPRVSQRAVLRIEFEQVRDVIVRRFVVRHDDWMTEFQRGSR